MPSPSRQVGEDTLFLCNHAVEQQWKNGEWKETVVKDWTFDSSFLLLSYLERHWNNGKLVPVSRNRNTNENGHLSEEVSDRWNDTLQEWQPTGKGNYMYDNKGNCIQILEYRWNGSDFVLFLRLIKSYDGAGRIEKTVSQNWKDGQWVNNQVTDRKFNSQGNIVEESHTFWKNSGWSPGGKASITYDSRGREIEMNSGGSRELTNYNIDGNSTERILQDYESGKWVNVNKAVTKLDPEGNIAEILEQSYHNPPPTWSDAIRYIYGYQKVVVHNPFTVSLKTKAQQFHLSHNFPNPFNATTQIQYTVPYRAMVSLKVYDILGREVSVLVDEMKDPGNYTATWNGQNMASGAYFYRMVSEGYAETGRMCLVK